MAAINALGAFINAVMAQTGNVLTGSEALELVESAEEIQLVLSQT